MNSTTAAKLSLVAQKSSGGQARYGAAWTYILARWRDWHALRADLLDTNARGRAARASILRARGVTAEQARAAPVRLGTDRYRYDALGMVAQAAYEDRVRWDDYTARLRSAVQVLRRIPGMDVPAALGALPLIPIGIGAVLVLVAAAMVILFRSQGIRRQQLALLDRASATTQDQVGQVLRMQADGQITAEQAIAEVEAIAASTEGYTDAMGSGGISELLGEYAPYLFGALAVAIVLPAVLGAVRPPRHY